MKNRRSSNMEENSEIIIQFKDITKRFGSPVIPPV